MATRSLTGDCRDVLRTLPDDCVVTSPPYFGLASGRQVAPSLMPRPGCLIAYEKCWACALAGRLRRAQTLLRTLGIQITFSREGWAGNRIIRVNTDAASTVSTVSVLVFPREAPL
jgi:hypothetical protein